MGILLEFVVRLGKPIIAGRVRTGNRLEGSRGSWGWGWLESDLPAIMYKVKRWKNGHGGADQRLLAISPDMG